MTNVERVDCRYFRRAQPGATNNETFVSCAAEPDFFRWHGASLRSDLMVPSADASCAATTPLQDSHRLRVLHMPGEQKSECMWWAAQSPCLGGNATVHIIMPVSVNSDKTSVLLSSLASAATFQAELRGTFAHAELLSRYKWAKEDKVHSKRQAQAVS